MTPPAHGVLPALGAFQPSVSLGVGLQSKTTPSSETLKKSNSEQA